MEKNTVRIMKSRLSSKTKIITHADLRSDHRIHAAIRSALRAGGADDVQADVREGFVSLSGQVRSVRARARIHKFVMGLPGVRAVRNDLSVSAHETSSDLRTALQIRKALDAATTLPPGTVVVHVHEGVATLNGHVRSQAEKYEAEAVATAAAFSVRVNNRLTIDPLDEISDEAAVRAVRSALDYCSEFETEGITVSCADGAICLRGEAATPIDRTLAEELARLQIGVRSVENRIQIRSPKRRV